MSAEHRPPVLDAERILRALDEHRVEYVLIGGMAVQTHGHTRMTNDVDLILDLIPDPDPANLERLAGALRELDARVLNPGHEDREITASMLPRAAVWQLATSQGDVDVMHEVPGATSYAELKQRALVVELGPLRIPVASRDDLIRMKLARGRPVDRQDAAALTDPATD